VLDHPLERRLELLLNGDTRFDGHVVQCGRKRGFSIQGCALGLLKARSIPNRRAPRGHRARRPRRNAKPVAGRPVHGAAVVAVHFHAGQNTRARRTSASRVRVMPSPDVRAGGNSSTPACTPAKMPAANGFSGRLSIDHAALQSAIGADQRVERLAGIAIAGPWSAQGRTRRRGPGTHQIGMLVEKSFCDFRCRCGDRVRVQGLADVRGVGFPAGTRNREGSPRCLPVPRHSTGRKYRPPRQGRTGEDGGNGRWSSSSPKYSGRLAGRDVLRYRALRADSGAANRRWPMVMWELAGERSEVCDNARSGPCYGTSPRLRLPAQMEGSRAPRSVPRGQGKEFPFEQSR